jgi:hypothetical protein
MIKPSSSTARAISNLESNPNWKVFIQWVDESAILQSIKGNRMRGEETIINQGRNLELEDLLKHISRASDYLKNADINRRMEQKE